MFSSLKYNNQIFSILDGIIPGEVFVDNRDSPKTTVIVAKWRLFFGGDETNREFITDMSDYIYQEWKEILKGLWGDTYIRLYPPNEEWKIALEEHFTDIVGFVRRYYIIRKLAIADWRNEIPLGYKMVQIDNDLLSNQNITNLDWLEEEYKHEWFTVEDFLDAGGGFCLVQDNKEIVCWSTLEYVTKNKEIECTVATKEEFQKKGFGTLTTAATSEYALSHYNHVGWHCAETNSASWKLAEKVGYELDRTYEVYELHLNKIDNVIFNGYTRFTLEQYEEAIDWYKRSIQLIKDGGEEVEESYLLKKDIVTTKDLHYRLGTLWAAIDRPVNAFLHLNIAVNLGFNDKERLLEEKLLDDLHILQEWKRLLKRIPDVK